MITCLYASPRREHFSIVNLTNEVLSFNFEYHDFGEGHRLTISNFDVFIHYNISDTENHLIGLGEYKIIIGYSPVYNLAENTVSFFNNRLTEIPFVEKTRAIFKSFSVQTESGIIIIKDIDELCALHIELFENAYIINISSSDTSYVYSEEIPP